jgi:hypothetical protein
MTDVASAPRSVPTRGAPLHTSAIDASSQPRARQGSHLNADPAMVNSNGCFEFDRVIKSGYVEKRTKTKVRLQPPPPT